MNKETVFNLVNEVREEHNLIPYVYNSELEVSAVHRANEICSTGNFNHDGWVESLIYNYKTAGENLAKNYLNESDTVEAWVASPDHYENIVGDFTESAIGISECGNNTYVVQHFATPLNVESAVVGHPALIFPMIIVLILCVLVLVGRCIKSRRNKNNPS